MEMTNGKSRGSEGGRVERALGEITAFAVDHRGRSTKTGLRLRTDACLSETTSFHPEGFVSPP